MSELERIAAEATAIARKRHAEYEALQREADVLRKEAEVAERIYRDAREGAAEAQDALLRAVCGELPPVTSGWVGTYRIQSFSAPTSITVPNASISIAAD